MRDVIWESDNNFELDLSDSEWKYKSDTADGEALESSPLGPSIPAFQKTCVQAR